MLKVLRSAAPVDPDAEALWRLIQADFYDNQRVIVEALHAKKALRPGLDVARAAQLLRRPPPDDQPLGRNGIVS